MRVALVMTLLLVSAHPQSTPKKRPSAPPSVLSEIGHHEKTLKSEFSYPDERLAAIEQLAEYDYVEASSVLLKTLERNVSERRKQEASTKCVLTEDGLYALTIILPENHSLVEALSRRKVKKALPVLKRMLTLDDETRGLTLAELNAHISIISDKQTAK